MNYNDLLRNAAGISDEFLLKATRETLVHALRELRQAARGALDTAARPEMTAVKLRVLDLLLQGNTNAQIGRALHRAEKTIKAHVTHIFRATGCNSRSEVIVKYYQNAWTHVRGEQHAG